MESLPLHKAFTLIEPGPVVLVTTNDGERGNVMTITWTMVLDFAARFAITTGPWNSSWEALTGRRECVLAIPGADLLDTAIGIGTCSGRDVDKFQKFDLTRQNASRVGAPLIADCLANIECRVVEVLEPYGIVILEGLAAWRSTGRTETRMLHAVGDGTFVVDGPRLDRRDAMRSKLPPGL